jgi:hypothetical protein
MELRKRHGITVLALRRGAEVLSTPMRTVYAANAVAVAVGVCPTRRDSRLGTA